MFSRFDIVNEENMTLKCVQVFFRHGARTPLKLLPVLEEVEFDKKILQPIDWIDFPSKVVGMDGSPVSSFPIEEMFNYVIFKGGGIAGQLTDTGRMQCYRVGLHLREKYGKIIGDSFDHSLVWMMTSPFNRCLYSLKSVLAGMYSNNIRSLDNISIKADTFRPKIFPSMLNCSPYKDAMVAMKKQIEASPKHKKITEILNLHFNTMMKNQLVDVPLIYDHMRSRKAHNLFVPEKLEELYSDMELLSLEYLYMNSGGRYNQVKHGLTLSMGRLVNTVAKNFEAVANNDTLDNLKPPAIFLFSGHDSTLLPMVEILGCLDKKFPDFANYLILELYKDISDKSFVQVLYNGKPMILRKYCQTVIPLEELMSIFKPFRINYDQFTTLCQTQEQ